MYLLKHHAAQPSHVSALATFLKLHGIDGRIVQGEHSYLGDKSAGSLKLMGSPNALSGFVLKLSFGSLGR